LTIVPLQSDLSDLFYSFTFRDVLPILEEVVSSLVKSSEEIMLIMESLAGENLCKQNHLMTKTLGANGVSCSKCFRSIRINSPSFQCPLCNVWLCKSCCNNVVTQVSEINFIRRYFRFSAAQLKQFAIGFSGFWE
jgi:hypothetical protein